MLSYVDGTKICVNHVISVSTLWILFNKKPLISHNKRGTSINQIKAELGKPKITGSQGSDNFSTAAAMSKCHSRDRTYLSLFYESNN